METLLLTDGRPRKTLDRRDITVPEGFILPEGEAVKQPFTLTVESGLRWHPDWPTPQVTVNACLALPLGDALVFSGTSLTALCGALLPQEVIDLATYHGWPIGVVGPKGKAALDALRLSEPKAKEPLAAFILPCQTRH